MSSTDPYETFSLDIWAYITTFLKTRFVPKFHFHLVKRITVKNAQLFSQNLISSQRFPRKKFFGQKNLSTNFKPFGQTFVVFLAQSLEKLAFYEYFRVQFQPKVPSVSSWQTFTNQFQSTTEKLSSVYYSF